MRMESLPPFGPSLKKLGGSQKSRQDGIKIIKNLCIEKIPESHAACEEYRKREAYPSFAFNELDIGYVLLRGQFATISEICSFKAKGTPGSVYKHKPQKPIDFQNTAAIQEDEDRFDELVPEAGKANVMVQKAFLGANSIRVDGSTRFAVKTLKDEVVSNNESFLYGLQALAMERSILSRMNHPNIVKVRAVSRVDAFSDYSFFVIDRLYETMEHRLDIWDHAIQGTSQKSKWEDPCYLEKIVIMYDLAEALVYLHKKKIVHRLINTHCLGFNVVRKT